MCVSITVNNTNLFHTLSNIHTVNIDRSFTSGLRCASFAGVYILGFRNSQEKCKLQYSRRKRGVSNNSATRVADEHNNNWPHDHNMSNFLRSIFVKRNKYIKIFNLHTVNLWKRENDICYYHIYKRVCIELMLPCLLFVVSFMNESNFEAKSVCYLDSTRRETEDQIFAQYGISLFPFSTLPVPTSQTSLVRTKSPRIWCILISIWKLNGPIYLLFWTLTTNGQRIKKHLFIFELWTRQYGLWNECVCKQHANVKKKYFSVSELQLSSS